MMSIAKLHAKRIMQNLSSRRSDLTEAIRDLVLVYSSGFTN
ncbi:hypothetical protein ALIPUT_01078 [Alistipes putredinis DSM 17216]|uniref:Uncharacterized protein n=1 Tax=Alistipes putredinis DSM 17216 TaxID=445970 RepID=B0MVD1_9BACT|nr:hypothetical protein ALIPUT_01078 [Alistipes putredinis DSM 17216]